MQLKTFDEILTGLCNSLDTELSPRSISRSNTNIIYLILKAIAKGYEIINNTCVILNNKFNPSLCTIEDLDSIASLVGTKRLSGSGSGLHINVINNNEDTAVILQMGVYYYALDDDTIFRFDVLEDTEIASGKYVSYIAMSENYGSYHVTAQESITVTSDKEISSDLTFSCTDNSGILGVTAETDLEFRERVLSDTTRQNMFVELENEIKNLPYIFDAKIKYNNQVVDESYDEYVIPPFTAAIFYSGEPRNDIAGIVANKLICATLQTDTSVTLKYTDSVFVSGSYDVHIIPFKKMSFGVNVLYKIDDMFEDDNTIRTKIRNALYNNFTGEVHKDYVKENDVYEVVKNLDLTATEILGINLTLGEVATDYISVPDSQIPLLTDVTFSRVE